MPRFDIDWVIRWRLERYCFPDVFVKPDLGDLLAIAGVIPRPIPGPDPGPIELGDAGLSLDRLSGIVGRDTASKLLLSGGAATLGAKRGAFQTLLRQPAFPSRTPPPVSPKLHELHRHERGAEALRELVRGKTDREYKLDLNRYVGPFPFWHCEWVLKEEVVPILEVPDITFWVTQDTDGDGDQETIYTDGWFQVGWKSGPLDDVILHASPFARINGTCEVPPIGQCEQPEILFAGLMPARAPYIDTSNGATRGFGLRVNPPHTDGLVRPSVFPPALNHDTPANAPLMGTLQLYGCNEFPNGALLSAALCLQWCGRGAVHKSQLVRRSLPGPGRAAAGNARRAGLVPDPRPAGRVVPASRAARLADRRLCGRAVRRHDPDRRRREERRYSHQRPRCHSGSTIRLPRPLITSLSWRVLPSGAGAYLPEPHLPDRAADGRLDIEFQVQYQVSATHLLKTSIGSSGCGGGMMQPNPEPNALPYMHWHTSAADNFVSQSATFVLPASALPGCYGFSVNGYSRAFNPAGGDPSDPQAHDWFMDATWLIWQPIRCVCRGGECLTKRPGAARKTAVMGPIYWLVVGALTTWRVTHLLHEEDGPWNFVVRLRAAAGSGMLGETMDCFYCLSLWLALPIALLVGTEWLERLLLWPALSAAAILVQRRVSDQPRITAIAQEARSKGQCVVDRTGYSKGRPWRAHRAWSLRRPRRGARCLSI